MIQNKQKNCYFLIVSLISKTQKMMKKCDNTKSKKLIWDMVNDKQVVPKNEDPDFVPTIWRYNFSKQKMKSKEKIVTQATIKKRNKAVRIYERKRKQHQNRWWSRLMIHKQFDTGNEPEGGSSAQGGSGTKKKKTTGWFQWLEFEALKIIQDFEDIQDAKLKILLNNEDWRS